MQLDWDKVSAELAKPLDAKAIRQPAPGKFGEYIDGLHAITEANRIFGRNGWSYEITRLEQVNAQVFEIPNKGPQYRCAWVCTVRATVDNVTREGAAVGTGMGKPENMGDAIESAVKEAETDALKRALRSLGNTFGLALYEKDKSRRETTDNVADCTRAIEYLEAADSVDDLTGRFKNLPKRERDAGEVIEAAKRIKAALLNDADHDAAVKGEHDEAA